MWRRGHRRPYTIGVLVRLRWPQQAVGGGLVVFNTGRRHRVRPQTEHALARAGIIRPRLLILPDDRDRPVPEVSYPPMNGRVVDP